MPRVVKVRFRPSGRVSGAVADGADLAVGDKVLVEGPRGAEVAEVIARPRAVGEAQEDEEARRVLRPLTPQDRQRLEANERRATRALALCREKAAAHGVPMRPVEAECSFDGHRITIYFTAEGRVDFRELVRDLAGALKARVEFRQIGVRDAARMLGGIGPCGRPLCCATFLTEFRPVSIRMAKEQNLALNPAKISGLCGRLLCCLRYESAACCASPRGADEGDAPERGVCCAGNPLPLSHAHRQP